EVENMLKDLLENYCEVKEGMKSFAKFNDHKCIESKLEILQNESKVEHFRTNEIFIESDSSQKEREIQKMLRDRAKEDKEREKSAYMIPETDRE
ncbi:hypothetical protein HHI36_016294, partial [Cryptolaemus montrouzieri]